MKNFTQITIVLFFVVTNMFGQQQKGITGVTNWLSNWTEFNPAQISHREPTQIITGTITEDTNLSKRETYLLVGSVFVTNNAVLTIEPGTVILADFETKASLTISKGSKIMAEGLETDPIVFTSNRSVKRPGDWGGILILGDAPTNKFGNGSTASYHAKIASSDFVNTNFGGDNVESDSGVLQYVRIEFAGKRTKQAGYFNGLLLACVGTKTVVENVMVSHCAGDAFKVWGGNLSIKNAVSYKTNSNDFSFNYGAQCTIENSLAVRSPYASNSEGSRCFEALSYSKEDEVDFSRASTAIIAKNITMVTDSDNLKMDIERGLVSEAVFVGSNTILDMNKSVISGFKPAVILDEKIALNQSSLEKIGLTDMYFNNCEGNIFIKNKNNNDDLENWYGAPTFFNVYSKGSNTETFIDMYNKRTPDFRLKISRIVASNHDDD
ncbi:MAG TPA: hypothetical protein VFF15_08620 [Flavobacteriaceae bacterium]|nr:hypothetical protein [Flavobacteriaceae bacterium]